VEEQPADELADREQAGHRGARLVEHARAVVGSGENLGNFVGRPLTVILLVLAIAAFILPNLPALSGWRAERAAAGSED
jgi:hypothetical protein